MSKFNVLPIQVVVDLRWMAWNISWHAANSLVPLLSVTLKGDRSDDEIRFREHTQNLFMFGQDAGLSAQLLKLFEESAWHSGWSVAHERFADKDKAREHKEKFGDCFTNILQLNEISTDVASSIKEMFWSISWYCSNERALNKADSRSDQKLFEYHFSQLTQGQKKGTVFLCHASEDKSKVMAVWRRLRADGYDPWIDTEKLLGGEKWDEEIKTSLLDSSAVLIFLSKTSVTKKGYVQSEIDLAIETSRRKPKGSNFLIPVKLEECDTPKHLHDVQWIELYNTGGYEKLLKSIKSKDK